MSTSGFVFTGQSGCLLPMLIMLNLFFGKLVFGSTRLWLGVESVLVLLFMIKIHAFTRKISELIKSKGYGLASGRTEEDDSLFTRQSYSQSHRPEGYAQGKVVDVKGEVVEEKEKLQ